MQELDAALLPRGGDDNGESFCLVLPSPVLQLKNQLL